MRDDSGALAVARRWRFYETRAGSRPSTIQRFADAVGAQLDMRVRPTG